MMFSIFAEDFMAFLELSSQNCLRGILFDTNVEA